MKNSGLLILPPANVGIFLEKLWPQSCQSMDALLDHILHRQTQNIQIQISRNNSPGVAPLSSLSYLVSPSVLSVKLNLMVTGDWRITVRIPSEYQHLL